MNNEKTPVRPHFVYVFTLLYPYLSLLIIPVIRGVYRFLAGKSSTLSAFFAAEVIMLCVAFLAALLKLKYTRLTFDSDITVQKGLIFRVRYTIPNKASRVVMLESDPFSRIVGIYRLKIYTEAGARRRPDEKLPISRKTAMLLFERLKIDGQTVKSNTVGNVVMSAALSSSMAGFLLAAPMVKAVASFLGEGISSVLPRLRQQSLETAELEAIGQMLPLVFLLGYTVSFAVLLLRNSGFSSVKSGNRIMLDSGRLPHRTAFLKTDSVNAVKTVTAPLMRLAGKCAVKFSACGFGRSKGEIGLLLPCVKPQLASGLVQWMLPEVKTAKGKVAPDKSAKRRCVLLPCILVAAVVFAARSLQLMLPFLRSVILSFAMITVIIILLWLVARLLVLYKGRFSVDRDSCSVTGRYGFGTVKLQCALKSVECITVCRTPFDRLHGHCTVKVRTAAKNRDEVKVKYLDYGEVKRVVYDTSQSV